ncbi:MAG TPA: PPC domain-containing DNA-binding protein [Patescibacteria group bacterium]|nr:PPC domain-containing DNA-binding protein [Patescibacteria group bacterium]
MQAKSIDTDHWVIRLARGESVIDSLTSFCKKKKISGGFFYGIGAIDQVELAHYNVVTKHYRTQELSYAYEVTNITGSIAIDKKTCEIIVHAHITLSDSKMRAFGGHLVEARVSGTLEMYLVSLPPLLKIHDDKTGLKVFDFNA